MVENAGLDAPLAHVSSSDDDRDGLPLGLAGSDASSLVSFSLGPHQKRLGDAASTFAADNVGGDATSDDAIDAHLSSVMSPFHSDDDEDFQSALSGAKRPVADDLPTPWRAGPKAFESPEDSRKLLAAAFHPRSRSPSASSMAAALGNLRDSISSTLKPFMPRASLAFLSTSNSPRSPSFAEHESGFVKPPMQRQRSVSATIPAREPGDSVAESIGSFGLASAAPQQASRGPPSLRRTASDDTLSIRSPLSRASTLGDDTRFENVREQINSRAKAIRDSWQDSTIRLPSLPSFTNLTREPFKIDNPFASKPTQESKSSVSIGRMEERSQRGVSSPTLMQTFRNRDSLGDRKLGGPSSQSAFTHPHFTKACAETQGDLVILGGYRGSILRSADPPNRQLWVPVKVGLNIRKVDLEVGLNVPEDDENMASKIIPGGMLTHIGPVDISRRLLRRLRACDNAQSGKLRVHDYGYDWRLDPIFLCDQLIAFLEGLPCNQPGVPQSERGALVIAHSLGGLITRRAVNQRPELFSGVVYAGTPSTCVNILGPMRNGDDVLMSSRVLTAQVNFTIRTSFALLPLDGKCFFNKDTSEEFPVDFFDPQTWTDYRLSPCLARPIPVGPDLPPTVVDGLISSFSSAMTSTRNSPLLRPFSSSSSATATAAADATDPAAPAQMDHPPSSSVATAVTIPRPLATAYLTTVLARVKRFKLSLSHSQTLQDGNAYPPAAVIFGKNTPTVAGAKVASRDAIRRADAFDSLAFASGDGVVLARAAMLPEGYVVARGGLVSSGRGHITLLGDLEAVGRAVNAVVKARADGVGLGKVE